MKLILPVWSLQKNMMVRLHWQGRDMRQKHQHNAMQCSVELVLPMQCSDCTVCLVIYLITHGRPVSDTLLWQGEVPYSVEMTLSDEWWHSLYGWLVSAGTSLLTPDSWPVSQAEWTHSVQSSRGVEGNTSTCPPGPPGPPRAALPGEPPTRTFSQRFVELLRFIPALCLSTFQTTSWYHQAKIHPGKNLPFTGWPRVLSSETSKCSLRRWKTKRKPERILVNFDNIIIKQFIVSDHLFF